MIAGKVICCWCSTLFRPILDYFESSFYSFHFVWVDKPFIQLIRSAVWGCCCKFNRCICDRLQTLKHVDRGAKFIELVNTGCLHHNNWCISSILKVLIQVSQPQEKQSQTTLKPWLHCLQSVHSLWALSHLPRKQTSPKEPIWKGNRVIIELNHSENVLRELGAATFSQKYGNRLCSLKLTDFRKGSFHQGIRSGQARSATLQI